MVSILVLLLGKRSVQLTELSEKSTHVKWEEDHRHQHLCSAQLRVRIMVGYWCRECQQWLEEDEVTEETEQMKRGTPLATVYIHEACGSYVARADEDQGV